MRRFGPLLLATVLFGAAVPVLAVSESAPDDLDRNRRLLERYRADPEHYARLLRDLRAFQALPAEKQERARQFDRDLHDLDADEQNRLWGVLQRYTDWVNGLSDVDQKRIAAAADRLAVVKDLRQKDWIARLPQKDREDLAALSPADRDARLTELRQQERQRRLEWMDWANAPKTHPEPGPRPNHPARLMDFAKEVQAFVHDELRPKLGDKEKERLDRAARSRWPTLAHAILDLSEDHQLTPPGPRELWNDARAAPPNVPRQFLDQFLTAEGVGPEAEDALQKAGGNKNEYYEVLNQEYFKKHPNQVEVWRRRERRVK